MGVDAFLSSFSGSVVLVAADQASWLADCSQKLAIMDHGLEMLAAGGSTDDGFWPAADDWRAQYRPYNVQDGVLTIPVTGTLLNGFSYSTPWATGYQYLSRAWDRGMADPNVKAVHLSISSSGGHAAGNFDLVDHMVATKTKPVLASAEPAYSAAYSLATPADCISVSRTGGAGSVGVVTGHIDVSKAMDKAGVKMTLISAPEGGDKTAGSPYAPLGDDHRDRMQASVDELYQHFVGLVSRNRSMDETTVRDTKGRTFTAAQALSNGLADTSGAPGDAMAKFLADHLASDDGETEMSNQSSGTVDQAAHDTAVASARAEGHAAGVAEGTTAERTRIDAILNSPEAQTHPALARKIAFKQTMSAADAASFMADLPAETPAPSAAAPVAAVPAADPPVSAHANSNFAAAMGATGGAGVTPGGPEARVEDPDDAGSALSAAAAMGIPGLRSTQKLKDGPTR